MKFFRKLKKGQKGFTLIELLVVVAILGVLAAVAIPNIIEFIGEGEDEAKVTELANVQVAATAAAASGDLGVVTAIGTARQLIADPTGTDLNSIEKYLLSDTGYEYTVTSAGVVTQGAKVP